MWDGIKKKHVENTAKLHVNYHFTFQGKVKEFLIFSRTLLAYYKPLIISYDLNMISILR